MIIVTIIYMMGQGYPKTYKSFVRVLTDWGQLIIVSPISLYLDINSRYEERLLSLRGSAVQGCPGWNFNRQGMIQLHCSWRASNFGDDLHNF